MPDRDSAASRPPIGLALVGVGKIARDQHLPALAAEPAFALIAAASRDADGDTVRYFSLEAMFAAEPGIEAVAICTPPQGRYALAAAALAAGKHVLIEKPPGATVAEVDALAALARQQERTLFAAWHSREAFGVAAARAWLAGRAIRAVRVTWKEDVRVWHPGQDWILEAGGLGVFDPAINALSILTRILPDPPIVEAAELAFPADRDAPIAATLTMRAGNAPITADLDFLQTGPQSWDIAVETDAGPLLLSHGGARLAIAGEPERSGPDAEYPRLYRRFADLIAAGESDVDATPLQLVADAFLIGKRRAAPPFSF